MKIKLLIASDHEDYAEHLSKALSENHSDTIYVSLCTSPVRLRELLAENTYDVALLDMPVIDGTDLSCICMPLVLRSEETVAGIPETLKRITKYQRISSIIADILENYAKASEQGHDAEPVKAAVSAVWSPVGGVGKTTVALALAAGKAQQGKQVLYLNLEPFSSIPVYFSSAGKSISSVFEMLEANEGNVGVLMQSILRRDDLLNIAYFCSPENYDDINILSVDNISSLISACCGLAEELVIDMSSDCDERTRHVFDCADKILLVADWTSASQIKLSQFTSQHNTFARIKEKTQLVANKGAAISRPSAEEVISLPLVQSADAPTVFKTLSACFSGNQP